MIFRHSKISYFYVAISVNEDVLRLEIAVNYILAVQVFNPQKYVCCVEPSSVLLESTDLAKVEK